MKVALQAIPLIPIGVLSSPEVVAPVVSSVVPSGWCSVSINVHGDWGVIHPSRSVRRVILGHVLSLRASIIPLGTWLLQGESSEGSISSEYISE